MFKLKSYSNHTLFFDAGVNTTRISTKWTGGLDVRDGVPSMSAACINAAPHSPDNGDWRKAKRPMQNEDFSASRI